MSTFSLQLSSGDTESPPTPHVVKDKALFLSNGQYQRYIMLCTAVRTNGPTRLNGIWGGGGGQETSGNIHTVWQ